MDCEIMITLRIPEACAKGFLAGLTGYDDDVMLAAEHAINNRLEFDRYGFDKIEIAAISEDQEKVIKSALETVI